MSRMLDHNTNPWKWSTCSRHYITKFLDANYGHCMVEGPPVVNLLDEISPKANHPGEFFDADKQCEFVFGNGSKVRKEIKVDKASFFNISRRKKLKPKCKTQAKTQSLGGLASIIKNLRKIVKILSSKPKIFTFWAIFINLCHVLEIEIFQKICKNIVQIKIIRKFPTNSMPLGKQNACHHVKRHTNFV